MKKLNAYKVYLIFSGVLTFASSIMFTVISVYYFTLVGMNPLQLVLVGTVLEGTILLFEIPTGVVADTFSRRRSVIIGVFVLGMAFIFEGLVPLFAAILVGEMIRGIGETFLSGATDAWLADEVGEENVGKIYLRSGQINRVVGLVGTGISVALASIYLGLPVVLGGVLYLGLGIFLLVVMPETGFKPVPREERNAMQSMKATLREGAKLVRGRPILLTLVFIGVFAGVASEGFDRLWEAHMLTNIEFPLLGGLQPVVWFGMISASANIVGFGTTEIFRRRLEVVTQKPIATARVLLVLNTLLVASVIGFALVGSFGLAFAALMVKVAVGGLMHPLYSAWLVQNIDSKVRATVLSMISQTDALGQVTGGPGVGAIGTVFSLRAAMVTAGILLMPASLLYGRVIRDAGRGTRQEEQGLPTILPVAATPEFPPEEGI